MVNRYWRPVSDRGRTTVMGGSHITPCIPIPYAETNVVMSCLLCLDSQVSDFSFLVEALGQSMGHRMVECASTPLSLSLYWTFRVRPEKQWSFAGALTNQLPQVIHLGYVAAWNQLPRDGGGVTSTAGRRWKVSNYYTRTLRTRSHWDHPLDGKVLMVAQIDPINLRHRAQGARVVWPLSTHCLAG